MSCCGYRRFFKLLQKKRKKEKKQNKTQKPAATLTSPGRLKPSCTYPCVPTPVFVSSPGSDAHLCSSPRPPCPALHPLDFPQGFKEEMKEGSSCLYQTERQQTQSGSAPMCVAAVSCRPSVQYGGIAPEPWARGALPGARCAACVNVNVNSLHRGPNRGISTEETFAK